VRKKKRDKNFSSIPNIVFDGELNERLNVEELFLLCFLSGIQNFSTNTKDINLKFLENKIQFTEHKDRNRKRVIKWLEQLHVKGYISISDFENVNFKKDNFEIVFSEKAVPPFTKVPNAFFDMVDSVTEFSLSCYILKKAFKTDTYVYISIEEFQKHLLNFRGKPFSDKTIRNALTNMKNKGIISKISGKRRKDDKPKQEENRYKINLEQFNKQVEKLEEIDDVEIPVIKPAKRIDVNEDVTSKTAKIDVDIPAETEEEKLKREAKEFVYSFPFEMTKDEYVSVHTHENQYVITAWKERRKKALENGFKIPNEWVKALGKSKKEIEMKKPKPQEELLEEIQMYEEHFRPKPFLLIQANTHASDYWGLINQLEEGEEKEKALHTYEMLLQIGTEDMKCV
jgi:hypothetical protein